MSCGFVRPCHPLAKQVDHAHALLRGSIRDEGHRRNCAIFGQAISTPSAPRTPLQRLPTPTRFRESSRSLRKSAQVCASLDESPEVSLTLDELAQVCARFG